MQQFVIRDIDLPADEAVAINFIDGLQRYEHEIEPDRRIDAAVGAEYFKELMDRVAANQGRAFMAEEGGHPIGWAVFVVEQSLVYIIEEERRRGYIAELFVVESARGRGVGQALIAACEEEARRLGLPHVMIGVLAANRRTADIYARAGFLSYVLEMRKYL